MRVIWLLLGVMLAQFLVLTVDASTTVWRWVNGEDSLCYTDDVTRVPKMYAEEAVELTLDGLDSYEKYTPIPGKTEINTE
jgi:hypothetical protein